MEKIRNRITKLLEPTKLCALIQTLSFIFNRSDNQDIRRTSKSLYNLLSKEGDDSIDI